jgi:hypothetical protein
MNIAILQCCKMAICQYCEIGLNQGRWIFKEDWSLYIKYLPFLKYA